MSQQLKHTIERLSDYVKGQLPREEIRYATEHWSEVWPVLDNVLNKFIQQPDSLTDPENQLIFMGLGLATQQKEPQAFPLLLKVCDRDDDYDSELDALLGDALTTLLPTYLHVLCEQDFEALNQLVFSQQSGPYVKSAAVSALLAHYELGNLSQAELESYIAAWLAEFSQHNTEVSAHFLASLAADCMSYDLQMFKARLIDLAKQGKMDPDYISAQDISAWGALRLYVESGQVQPEFDLIDELSKWASYRSAEEKAQDQKKLEERLAQLRAQNLAELAHFNFDENNAGVTYFAPAKIGRNDPCSCGSGKKYKKCCM